MPAISFAIRLEFIMTLYKCVCVVSDYFYYSLTFIYDNFLTFLEFYQDDYYFFITYEMTHKEEEKVKTNSKVYGVESKWNWAKMMRDWVKEDDDIGMVASLHNGTIL